MRLNSISLIEESTEISKLYKAIKKYNYLFLTTLVMLVNVKETLTGNE